MPVQFNQVFMGEQELFYKEIRLKILFYFMFLLRKTRYVDFEPR
jgi:hypothetical protein